jgi:integrase/recombinase XerD
MNRKVLSRFRDDMQLHGLSVHTQEAYERHVRRFLEDTEYPKKPVSLKRTKKYLLKLVRQEAMNPSTRNQHAAAVRFFLSKTLGKDWAKDKIPNSRTEKKLPEVLNGAEIIRLMRSFDSQKQKTVAMLCYGAGLRVSEAISLTVKDIDSEGGVIHVRRGKGNKERVVALGESLLNQLRKYWVSRRPTGQHLFPGNGGREHIGRMSFNKALRKAVAKAGIDKSVTPHTLRHSYATHMIESGVDLRSVQLLLGHSSLQSTSRYIHLTHARMQRIQSPLDVLSRWAKQRKQRQGKAISPSMDRRERTKSKRTVR